MSSTLKGRFGVLMGMVISTLLIVAIVCVLCIKPTDHSKLNMQVNTDNIEIDSVENYESYTPSKSATSNIHSVGGEQQGVVSIEASGKNNFLSARPITSELQDSFVFAYWTKNNIKISGDSTIVVSDATSNYKPVFVKEFIKAASEEAGQKSTALVHYISTMAEFATAVTKAGGNGSGHIFILTKDINLSAESYTPVATFSGVFDGRNHKIEKANITTRQGLICDTLSGGVVKNLVIKSGQIRPSAAKTSIGSIAGTMQNSLISRCINHAKILNKANGKSGGIVGASTGSAKTSTLYCNENYGVVSGAYAGAILYDNTSSSAQLIKNINNGSLTNLV